MKYELPGLFLSPASYQSAKPQQGFTVGIVKDRSLFVQADDNLSKNYEV